MSNNPAPSQQKTTLDFFAHFLKRYPRHTLTVIVLLVFGSVAEGFSVLTIFPVLKVVIEGEMTKGNGLAGYLYEIFGWLGLSLTLTNLILVIIVGLLIKGVLMWIAMHQVAGTISHIATRFRLDLMHALFRARWRFFTEHPSGALANAVSGETTYAASAYLQLCRTLSMGLQALVYAGVVALVSWKALLFAAGIGLLLIGVLGRLIGFSYRAGLSEANITRAFVTRLIGTVQGIKPIRAMAREHHFEHKLQTEAWDLQRVMKYRISAGEAILALHEPVVAVALGTGFLLLNSFVEMDFAFLLVLGALFWRISVYLNRMLTHYQIATSQQHFFWSLQALTQASEAAAEDTSGTARCPPNFGHIAVERVGFAYEEREESVFNELSLKIPANQMTVLVGPSGSGKSTLLDLLMAFIRPSKGEIFVGEQALSSMSVLEWRGRIGYVPQEMVLMHDTIFHNLTLGDESITREQAREALSASGAWEFVSSMPDGMDTVVGEQGARLSGGQRQRIALARALVGMPSLLILDEVTTALDPRTERAVVETLDRLKAQLTIVAVTHQNALVEAADVVYRLGGQGEVSQISALESHEPHAPQILL